MIIETRLFYMYKQLTRYNAITMWQINDTKHYTPNGNRKRKYRCL